MKRCLLTIGGLDVLGGGGIGTDMKTMEHYGFFSLSVISLVAGIEQGEFVFHEMDVQRFEMQLATCANFQDELAGIKIGMLANPEQIKAVYQFCQPFVGKIPIVIDPCWLLRKLFSKRIKTILLLYNHYWQLRPSLRRICQKFVYYWTKIPDNMDSVQRIWRNVCKHDFSVRFT